MTWSFGPQIIWTRLYHEGVFISLHLIFFFYKTALARWVKNSYVKCNLICLSQQWFCTSVRATHHVRVVPVLFTVPLRSARVSDHPELTNHPLVITRTNHFNAPVTVSAHHSFSNACQRSTDDLHWVISGVYFSSQLPPIKCANLCGAQNLNRVTTDGCCHSWPGCYLASSQRVVSSTWRCAFFEVVFAGHIHLKAVVAPAYETGQHDASPTDFRSS